VQKPALGAAVLLTVMVPAHAGRVAAKTLIMNATREATRNNGMAGLPERRSERSVGIGNDRRLNCIGVCEPIQPQPKSDVRFAAMNF
jgi:hypothetical protein